MKMIIFNKIPKFRIKSQKIINNQQNKKIPFKLKIENQTNNQLYINISDFIAFLDLYKNINTEGIIFHIIEEFEVKNWKSFHSNIKT